MQAAASINPLLNAIGEHIAAFSASVTLSGSLPTRSHNVRELTALRDDPSVVHSVVQSDADLEHIDQLQTSLAEARLRLQMRRAKLENALSMVNVLPPEIIRIIFSEAHFGSKDGSRTVLAISHVNSSWRAFALQHSALWSNINVAWSVTQQLTWLSRAGAQPLDLCWRLGSDLHHARDKHDQLASRHPRRSLSYFNEFDATPLYSRNRYIGPCDALWELSRRWRSLRLVSLGEPMIRRFLRKLQDCSDLSSLDTICLHPVQSPRAGPNNSYDVRRGESNGLVLDFTLFAAPLPKLTSVSVCRVMVVPVLAMSPPSSPRPGAEAEPARSHIFASIMSKLWYLRLTSIDANVHSWASLLKPCTSLRVLVISGGQVSSSRALPPALHVSLPELEALGLEDTSAATMHFVAHSLEMPKLKILHLDFPNDQFDHPMFFRPAARCLDVLFSNCATITTLQVARESWVQPVVTALSSDRIFLSLNRPEAESSSHNLPPELSDDLPPESPAMVIVSHQARANGEMPTSTVLGMIRTRFEAEGGTGGNSQNSGFSWDASSATGGVGSYDLALQSRAEAHAADTPERAGMAIAHRPNFPSPTPPSWHTPSAAHRRDRCLLPELRVLRLNMGWGEDVKELVRYRGSLVDSVLQLYESEPRTASGGSLGAPESALTTTASSTHSTLRHSTPPSVCAQGSTPHISLDTRCQTVQVKKPYALDTLGLMRGPTAAADPSWKLSDSKDDALWLKKHVQKVEINRIGWWRLDEGLVRVLEGCTTE